tara:strand:- start:52 stop:1698 length:1647 start_codon:yes stop_codon:yes gene_type:complete
MQILKSAFFYFLNIKTQISNFFRIVYYSSKYYHSSIESKKPKQFFFFPNSFLLSSFTNYKDFSLKISSVDPYNFWVKQNTKEEEHNLHGFLWLNVLDRKNEAGVIRKIIEIWITKNKRYNSTTWEETLTSKRVISWILNADIILESSNHFFKEEFLKSIILQTNHLKKCLKFERDEQRLIEILTAISLTGLVFKEYNENLKIGLRGVKKIVDDYFDSDGFPLSRNPYNLLKFLKHFILIKECTKEAQEIIPEFIENILDKNLDCLKTIITPDQKLPLFNGTNEIHLEEFFNYLSRLNIKPKKLKKDVGFLKILKHKKDVIYFDFGPPPPRRFSQYYQSGPLSFEYFYDGEKIITNSGFGKNLNSKNKLYSRLTSAQSTICMNETSVVKFQKKKFVSDDTNFIIDEKFKVMNQNFFDNEEELKIEASHNAYLKKYNCWVKREIILNKKTDSLNGVDEIKRENHLNKVSYAIRFHLYPGINVVKTIGGESALIQINKNKSLIFLAKGQELNIEKSVFFGRNKMLNSFCINIMSTLETNYKKIYWEIKKNI